MKSIHKDPAFGYLEISKSLRAPAFLRVDLAPTTGVVLTENGVANIVRLAAPSQKNLVQRDFRGMEFVTEGRGKIIKRDGVFYNPIMEFNRDLSVAVIQQFRKSRGGGKEFRILEGLSASGVSLP